MSAQIEINKIRTDGGTQSRAQMDNETISEYVEIWKSEGGAFPDVSAFFDGTDYWLDDGFHRLESAKLAGKTTINTDVKQGTRRDAVLASTGANARHGLKRTNADKRRAALVLLNDDEWSKWSDRAIADKVGVSNRFVSTLRNELSVQRSQMQLPDQTRTVTRNGTTYEMTMPAKQDKKLITSNPVSSNQAIDTALLIALYNWNNAIGPALPAHLASKARTAVQIAEDLTELVRAGYATTVQSLADDGVKTAVVVTLSGCELLQKPFPAKIEQPAPETAHEILKTGDKVAILSGFGENKEAIIKEVDYSVDPVEFRVQILNDGKETIAHVKHVASNLKLIQRAGAAEQPVTHNGLKVGRSRGGTIAEPAKQTPGFKVGDYVITLTGDRVEIIGINGRIINVKGRNGERKVGVSYCVDCGLKRHPQKPAPLYPYTDEPLEDRQRAETITADTRSADDSQPIEIVMGWLMGYEIGGETTPDLLTYIEVARRWLDRLEDEISQELEPVEA